MASYQRLEIIGHLGQDPELKKYKDQDCCKFSVATSESFMKNGTKFEKTEWHRVTVWEKNALHCAKYLKVGSKVFVEGKLETTKYNKDGVDHYSTQVIAFKVLFLDSKTESKTKEQGTPSNAPAPENEMPQEEPDWSQIPF